MVKKKSTTTTARKGGQKTTTSNTNDESTAKIKKKTTSKTKKKKTTTTTRILGTTSDNPNNDPPTYTPSSTTNNFFTRCNGKCCTFVIIVCFIVILIQLNYDIEFSTYHFTNTISIQQKKTTGGEQVATTTGSIETGETSSEKPLVDNSIDGGGQTQDREEQQQQQESEQPLRSSSSSSDVSTRSGGSDSNSIPSQQQSSAAASSASTAAATAKTSYTLSIQNLQKQQSFFPNVMIPNPNRDYWWQRLHIHSKDYPTFVFKEKITPLEQKEFKKKTNNYMESDLNYISNDDDDQSSNKMVIQSMTTTPSLSRPINMTVPSLNATTYTTWGMDTITSPPPPTTTTTTSTTSSSSTMSGTHTQHSIVFYGSSHLRELYYELIRLKRGIPYNSKLENTVVDIPNGNPTKSQSIHNECGGGPHIAKYGVDITTCGVPGKRVVPELSGSSTNPTVAFGFKTVLHTPESDQIFLDFLQQQDEDEKQRQKSDVSGSASSKPASLKSTSSSFSLRHPSVLVIDIGVWGPRGQRINPYGSNETKSNVPIDDWHDEVTYYMNWLQTNFPTSHIVYIFEYAFYVHKRIPNFFDYILNDVLLQLYNNKDHNVVVEQQTATTTSSSVTVNEKKATSSTNKIKSRNYGDSDDGGSVRPGSTTTTSKTNNAKQQQQSQSRHQRSILILRKDIIEQKLSPGMPCEHGCAGPVVEVVARLFLTWLTDIIAFERS